MLPVSGMCLILGFMMMLAELSDSNLHSRLGLLNPNQQGRVSIGTVDIDAYRDLQAQVTHQLAEITKLQTQVASHSADSKLLFKSLEETKAFAGLTPVEGPGVIVTLRDSPHPKASSINEMPTINGQPIKLDGAALPENNVHDTDVLQLVNELFAAGADAISVNDHRLAGPTSIRCVGPTILVDDINIASPIVVQAIGDPKTMMGALNLNGGVLDDFRRWDPDMVQVEEAKYIKLEPYSGRSTFHLAKAIEDK